MLVKCGLAFKRNLFLPAKRESFGKWRFFKKRGAKVEQRWIDDHSY